MSDANRLCPFCGGAVDEEGWTCNDGTRGPECEVCGATANSIEEWNARYAPAVPPNTELDSIVECLAIFSPIGDSYGNDEKHRLMQQAKDAIQSLRAQLAAAAEREAQLHELVGHAYAHVGGFCGHCLELRRLLGLDGA